MENTELQEMVTCGTMNSEKICSSALSNIELQRRNFYSVIPHYFYTFPLQLTGIFQF